MSHTLDLRIEMRVETSHGNEITNLEGWAKLYDTPLSSHQWKVGRSAHSVAEFFLNRNGAQILQDRVSEGIGKSFENQVRFAFYFLVMKPVPETTRMQALSHEKFRICIFASYCRHHPTSFFR